MVQHKSPLGARLRAERLAQNLTAERLAAMAGTSKSHVLKAERQARGMTVGTLEKLASALGIPPGALLSPDPLEFEPSEDQEEVLRFLDEALEEVTGSAGGYVPRFVALYRYYDEQDIPLYIGIAGNVRRRQRSHISESAWMEFAARSTISRYSTRGEALKAEELAIQAERPLFNVNHNNTLRARLRLVEYLTEHERTDLIPLIRWPSPLKRMRELGKVPA